MSSSTSGTDRGRGGDAPPAVGPSLGVRARTKWLLAATVALGLVFGLGVFTFGFAKGHSYLTKDPAACANCHVMGDYLAAWEKGSHRAAATCNDCHTPHSLVGKYATKASNGFWHSFYFTTGRFPDPIRITPRNRQVTERACRDCHAQLTAAITPGDRAGGRTRDGRTVAAAHAATQAEDVSASCIRCHSTVGHWVR